MQIELAAGACYEERFEEMLVWAEQAREGAARLGQRAIEAVATGQLAVAQYFLGLPAVDAMEQAAAGMDALDDAELAGCLDLGRWVGAAEMALERHERNVEHCQRVIDVARATGQGAALLVTMTTQASSLMQLGRLDEAEEQSCRPRSRRGTSRHTSTTASRWRSRPWSPRTAGTTRPRSGWARTSVRLARSADENVTWRFCRWSLATALLEIGEARRALEIMLDTGGGERPASRWGAHRRL